MSFLGNWFKKKIFNVIKEYHEPSEPDWQSMNSTHPGAIVSSRQSKESRLRSNGLDFTIYMASGGYVIEYHSYDFKKDESINRIHVIPEGDDVGESISKIITLELLRS